MWIFADPLTAHWLAVEGVQPSIPQNPTTAESRSQDLLPKGPAANPTLAALAGHDSATFRPAVKHILSKELILYFEKVQAAVLDDTPDPEVERLRAAALASVADDPGIHQLVPYFVNFISNEVTHRLDDVFVLRQMMNLTASLIDNRQVFLGPYASPLSAPVLTCLMGRKLGSESGSDAVKEQYELRQTAASLIGKIAHKYVKSNKLLRPKLVRTCLKSFLDVMMPAPVWYGAISGMAAAGGPEAIKLLVLPILKDFETSMLRPLQEKGESSRTDFEVLVGAIVKAVRMVAGEERLLQNGISGGVNEREAGELRAVLGDIIGERIAKLGDQKLNQAVLDARSFQ